MQAMKESQMTSQYNRRRFLKASLGSAVMAPLCAQTIAAQGPEIEWRNRSNTMRYRKLGRTGLMVSEIVMGGN